MRGAQLHVLIADEWQLVPGITDLEFSSEPAGPAPHKPTPKPPPANRPSRAARRGNRARPAWQTPYGPATRHY